MAVPHNLIRLMCKPKTGCERFRSDDGDLDFGLYDFWRWSMSDLVRDATRGRLAEFIVAKALSISIDAVRDEWGAYDLKMPEGIKIEVKSAAYIQSWNQSKLSAISFRTPRTLHLGSGNEPPRRACQEAGGCVRVRVALALREGHDRSHECPAVEVFCRSHCGSRCSGAKSTFYYSSHARKSYGRLCTI